MAKNTKLKFDLTESTTTNPVDSAKIYAAALIQGGSKATFTPILDVKDKARIRKHSFGNVLQVDGCTFNAQGEGELTEKLVDACPIKINLEICQSTLESSFVSSQLAKGSNNADFLPAEFQAYLVAELAKKMSADFEKLAWQGDVSNTGGTYPIPLCEGLIGKMQADATVIDVTATTVTSSNVIAELNKVYVAIPEAVLFDPTLVIYVSTNIAQAYKQAVAAASSEAYYTKDAELSFLGIKLVVAQGLPANRMAAMSIENVFIITDLMSDFEDVRILPQMNTSGDDTVRMVGRVKFAVDYAYGAEVVLYS
jgi:hypothetical protein